VDHPFPHTRGTNMINISRIVSQNLDGNVGVECESTEKAVASATNMDKAPCPKMGGAEMVTGQLAVEEVMQVNLLSPSSLGIETVRPSVQQSSAPIAQKWIRKRPLSHESEDFGSDTTVSERSVRMSGTGIPKRGRGRPPTTGQYVGVAAAKREYLKTETLKRIEAEKEMAELSRKVRATRVSRSRSPDDALDDSCTTAALSRQVAAAVDSVIKVAEKSKTLKGTFARALKEAVTSIKEATLLLAERSVNDETAQLQADNNKLQTQIEQLRKEMADLRAELVAGRSIEPRDVAMEVVSTAVDTGGVAEVGTSKPQSFDVEELAQRIMIQVGTMVNARFEGIQTRLLPEVRLRPPLAAEKAKNAQPLLSQAPSSAAAIKEALEKNSSPATKPQKGKKGGKAKTKPKTGNSPASVAEESRPSSAPLNSEETWAVVVKRTKGNTHPKQISLEGQPDHKRQTHTKQATIPTKVRTPRSAAVVITLQPSAVERGVTYNQVIRQAKASIDVDNLGIKNMRCRKAATGAYIFEIPGCNVGDKADILAGRIQALFKEDDVKVARPTKCADLRVSGLDDSVTPQEVTAAISKAGECSPNLIKTGEIRREASGLGSLWLSIPVAAAKKVAQARRVCVGWVSARVQLLEPRGLRCFRCFEPGHVRSKCTAEVDRSSTCYRCGQDGHKAGQCIAAPNCILCTVAKKPAKHSVGSAACKAQCPFKAKGRNKAARTPNIPPRTLDIIASGAETESPPMET
jgi:hypothetical protein